MVTMMLRCDINNNGAPHTTYRFDSDNDDNNNNNNGEEEDGRRGHTLLHTRRVEIREMRAGA